MDDLQTLASELRSLRSVANSAGPRLSLMLDVLERAASEQSRLRSDLAFVMEKLGVEAKSHGVRQALQGLLDRLAASEGGRPPPPKALVEICAEYRSFLWQSDSQADAKIDAVNELEGRLSGVLYGADGRDAEVEGLRERLDSFQRESERLLQSNSELTSEIRLWERRARQSEEGRDEAARVAFTQGLRTAEAVCHSYAESQLDDVRGNNRSIGALTCAARIAAAPVPGGK